jgi:uncharacterized protein YdeI (YjbR/CyaY-like superfamily)
MPASGAVGNAPTEGAVGWMSLAARNPRGYRTSGRASPRSSLKRHESRRIAKARFVAEDQSMNRMNPKVDFFFSRAEKWQEEFEKLRTIILDCGLTEGLKWGCPCYTFQKRNVVLIHGFKEYCALLFFKGVLLKDAQGILIQQTKNVQAARQIRFTQAREIVKMKPVLKAYIHEAMEVEKAGLKVHYKKAADFIIPEEFQGKLDEIPALKTAFKALTPGRQRAYLFYFAQPKQSKTRESRVEKCMRQILMGKGFHEE